jgi:hypothetical protein
MMPTPGARHGPHDLLAGRELNPRASRGLDPFTLALLRTPRARHTDLVSPRRAIGGAISSGCAISTLVVARAWAGKGGTGKHWCR